MSITSRTSVDRTGQQQPLSTRRKTRGRAVLALALGVVVAELSPLGITAARGASATWSGATNQDWNTVTNWENNTFPTGSFPDGVATVNVATGNFPVVTATSAFTPSDINIGVGSGFSGRVDHIAGTVSTGGTNWMFIGCNGGTAVYNLADTSKTGGTYTGFGTGSGNLSVAGNLYIGGRYFDPNGVGTVNVNTTGSLTAGNLVDVSDGQNGSGNGTLNLDNGTVSSGGEFWTGAWTAAGVTQPVGTTNQSGGTAQAGSYFVIGRGGNGQYNLTGGTLNSSANNAGFLVIGSFGGANGTLNASGGVVNAPTQLYIGEGGNGSLNISGTASITVGNGMQLGVNAGGAGIVNLNGGTLQANSISKGAGSGTFNFNGGTLKAGRDGANLFVSMTAANVKAGGAIIDTGTYSVTATQGFTHDAALGATPDGGLVKRGVGVLQISGSHSYTGTTKIESGTLQLPTAGSPTAVAKYSFDDVRDTGNNPVTSGSLNDGYVVVNGGSGGSALNGVTNNNDNLLGPGTPGGNITAGKFGNGLHFDGLGSSVDVNSRIVDQDSGGIWTFNTWVKTGTAGSSWLSKNSGTSTWNSGHSVYYLATNPVSPNPGALPTAVRNSGGFLQGNQSVTDNAWHMITFVDAGGTKTIYVDGVAVAQNYSDYNGVDTSTFTRIAYNTDSLSNVDGNINYTGDLDEMSFFNVALSAQQIQQLFASNTITAGNPVGQYLPAASAVDITGSGAALDLNGNDQVIGSLNGVSGSKVILGTGNLTLGGNNTSTTFAGNISGTGGVTKVGSGTQTLSGSNSYSGATTVKAGAIVTKGATNQNLLLTGVGGADVQGGRLIFDYSGGVPDPSGTISTILKNGYNLTNKFSSGQIRSTTANAQHGLGWVQNTGNSTVTVMYTYYGDANLDGAVNGLDFSSLANNFGLSGKVWVQGDFNYDGSVNGLDFSLLANNFGLSVPGDPAPLGPAVPEPATGLLLAAAAAVGGLARRRRRG